MSHHKKRELLRLARNGDIRRLRALLEDDVDVNFLHHKTGMTPLMTAAYAGHVDAVNMLLESDASPNLTADDGASALHWASRNGHLEIVQMLLDLGADVNPRRETEGRDDDGPAPLHFAISHSHDSIAIALINSGASLDIMYFGRDIREFAEQHNRNTIVQYIRDCRYRHPTMPT